MHVAIGNPPMGEPEILIQQSAKAASIEQDPKRLIERFNKLTQALDEDRQRKHLHADSSAMRNRLLRRSLSFAIVSVS
jgi:hypothetical protein